MTWLTLQSNGTIWHVNMDLVETVKVQHHQDAPTDKKPIETISIFFKNDEEPSLQFTDEEDEIEVVGKALQEFMNKHKKS